ncbi:HAMP domain-containing sensor histidine kinase [Nocardioides sp. YIM 152315]|uniref:sensor histidine kinase n=1 Tax=Nocardioides sp. YIM 152315 TaxID=3031760 RepID=UPI0023DB9DB3|nr:HAMP domain-containing sensor histidine kinase [Nocardioides sp. YIM 152315]MDF1606293.1 HAMP domain-containing sensor histidine kinase [Nocardioides sp. YIM 152315]
MRRSLILTVAAAVSMVLLAMLVPMAVLLRGYALEDRLSRAALEVQATETVVSGQDEGAVATYLETINEDDDVQTTVLYPPDDLHPDGEAVGPSPGEDRDVVQARLTGQARVRDVDGGAEILVPVSLGPSSAGPESTPVIRVEVRAPGFESDIVRAWLVLLLLGVVLLAGALALSDRLGRSFVQPIRRLASYAGALGDRRRPDPVPPSGPPEVRELTTAMNRLVGRIESLLERERAGVADVSHRLRTPMTALRLRIDGLADADDRTRLSADLDELQATVDHIVREARRSEREGVVPLVDAVSVVAERVRFWAPLAEDQDRGFDVRVEQAGPVFVPASEQDLQALVDVLLDNVFTHTPEDADVTVTLMPRDGGGLRVTVDDGGPGFPQDVDVAGRGESGAGSTGLGLSIVDKTATESGGGLSWGASPAGGARVVVDLGPAAR